MSQHRPDVEADWRTQVFRNRGLLLVPVALVLVSFGSPSVRSTIVGIAVAVAGELLRIWAVGYAGATTRAGVITAPKLVTAGPYSYVRNPLYVGNAIIALGFWLAFSGNVTPATSAGMFAVILALVVGVYAAIVPLEEIYLMDAFGAAYLRYKENVARIIPAGVLPREQREGEWRAEVIPKAEVITLAYFALMVVAVVVKLRLWR